MTKLIAHEYLKEFIFHDMALKKQSAEGLEIISLNRLFSEKECESEQVLILKLAKLLRSNADQYPDYNRMFSFPSFYREVLSFAKQLALWKLGAEALPAADEGEKQLKEIIRTALSLNIAEKKMALKTEEALSEALSQGYTLVDSFENSYFNYTAAKTLLARGIQSISYWDQTPSHITRRHALSTRMEIEGCAQYICRNEKPCVVVLCNPASQMPVLTQVFERYGIPFSYTVSAGNPVIGRSFRALAEFAVYKDSSHLIRAIEAQAFSSPCDDDLIDFLRQVLDDVKAPDQADAYAEAYARTQSEKYDPEKAWKRDPVTVYRRLENRARKYFAEIQPALDVLLAEEDPKKKLIACYETLSTSPLLVNSEEMAAGKKILSRLQDCIDLIENDEDVLFFSRMSENLSASSHKLVTDFCTVTDLRHPVLPKENTYVIGCSGKAYPGFQPMSGVFDETYIRTVSGFPTLEERQNAYLDDLSWITHSCSGELIFSNATNDYQGRELIGAYELDQYEKPVRWDLESYDEKRRNEHALSKAAARSLFIKEDENGPFVSGSISSVESWFRCPYRYFLASGLYVRKPQKPDLSAESAGTWQHAAMEKAIFDKDGKPDPDYAEKLDEARIKELISPYFDALRIANPNDLQRISISENRMISSLLKAARFLAEYERASAFEPDQAELNFRRFGVADHVRLSGTIDRISRDAANHMIEIIDYKSSSKTLSLSSVRAGQQLQLLTYLCAAMELYEKKDEISPAGTYYFSLTAENISKQETVRAASVNRSTWKLSENDFRNDPEQMRQTMIKNRQLSGWTFTDRTDAVDSEGKYVSGTKKKYLYDSVRECLYTLYEYFYSRLTGDEEDLMPEISASPVEGACDYCDYKGICRFHGEPRKPAEIYSGTMTEERKKTK